MKWIKTILFSLFGLLIINGGLSKFLHYMPTPEDLPAEVVKDSQALAEIVWLIPLIGIAEILGGLLILIPKTRALGALIVFPVMTGVLLHHSTVAVDGLPMALLIWALLIWIILDNKKKYLPLVQQLP